MDKLTEQRILKDIELSFENIKREQDVHGSLKSIKMALAKLGIGVKEITIVPSDKDEFFGMSVFPETSVSDKIVDCMINNKPLQAYEEIWTSVNYWIIEIDSKLIYDRQLNANPAELTAALLHEVGHVVYSNTIPQKLNKTMSLAYLQLPAKVKHIIKIEERKFKKVFLPVVAQASMNVSYSLKKEIEADKYVIKMGYGQALDALLQKILLTYGSRFVECDDKEQEKNLKVACNWSSQQVIELQNRKDILKASIDRVSLVTPSKYIKALFEDMNKSIFKGMESMDEIVARRGRGVFVTEGVYMDLTKPESFKYVLEAANKERLDKQGRVNKVTQHDVDIVAIQAEKIVNQNDKIYLLDVIYDYIETLDLMDEYLHNGKKSSVQMTERQIKDIRDQLEALRIQVLKFKIVEKQYGVFIKYPVGYEG